MLYHLTYHYSIGLHINHLVFLHAYVVAVFVIFCGAGLATGVPYLDFVFPALFAIAIFAYSAKLGGLYSIPYWGIVTALLSITTAFLQPWLGDYVMCLIVGFSLMLFAFICQLIGHAMHEVFQAPPNFLHGFFAAPVLEWFSLLLRLGLMPTENSRELWARVDALRQSSLQ